MNLQAQRPCSTRRVEGIWGRGGWGPTAAQPALIGAWSSSRAPGIKSSSSEWGPHMMLANTGRDAQERENLWRHVGMSARCRWLSAVKVCFALGKSNWPPARRVQTPEGGFRSQRRSYLKREVHHFSITRPNMLVESQSRP